MPKALNNLVSADGEELYFNGAKINNVPQVVLAAPGPHNITTEDVIIGTGDAALAINLPLAADRPGAILTFVTVGTTNMTVTSTGLDFINIPGTDNFSFSGDRNRRHYRSNGQIGWYSMDQPA